MPPIFTLDTLGKVFQYVTATFGAFLAALWLSLVFWTYRDMRARSTDRLLRLLAALLVSLLGPLGLIVYAVLRPPRTLAELYQHTLEEEALLTEIESHAVCPGCGLRTVSDWQICPQCHTRLRRSCPQCGRLLEPRWKLCPYCAKPVPETQPEAESIGVGQRPAP